jgi:hypothetical protein
MAQGRMLRKEICESDSFAALKDTKAQLLVCLLTPWWDDHGKMIGDPRWIKGNIVRKLQQFTEKEISRCLAVIDNKLDVQWWTDDKGNKWLYWNKFDKHQTISQDKKTKDNLPSPKIPKNPQETSATREEEVEVEVKKKFIYVDWEKSTHTLWNSFCDKNPTLSKIKEITDTRRKHLKERFTKDSFRDFEAILAAVAQQPFLIKGNPNNPEHKDWKISFDWLIENDTNYIKVLELRYKNKTVPGDVRAADPDCRCCHGTGWAQDGEGRKVLCQCRINK